jgi:hypothetical protein
MRTSTFVTSGLVAAMLAAAILPVSAALAAGGSWTAPVNVSAQAPGDDAEYPSIAHDGAGNAIALWAIDNPLVNSIQSSTSRDGGATWSAPVELASGDDIYESAISFDASGNAIAIWQSNISGDFVVQTSWSNDSGATWSDAELISDLGLAAYYLGLTFDSLGNAVAVWRSDDGSVATVLASTSTNKGATWSDPVPISAGDQSTIAADANGNVIVTLLDNNVVRASRSTDSGLNWSAPVPVSEVGPLTSGSGSMTIDATGRAIVIFGVSDGSRYILHASTSTDSGLTWSDPVPVSEAGETTSSYSLSFDATGRAIAIWRGNGDGDEDEIVRSSTSADGGLTWTDPIAISAIGLINDTGLTHDANNRALAIWVDYGSVSDLAPVLVSSTSTDAGTTWSTPVEFSAPTGDIEIVLLTGFDDAGRAIALWSDYDNEGVVKSSVFSDPSLADTGADSSLVGSVTALGGGLLVAGALALLLTRRRRG